MGGIFLERSERTGPREKGPIVFQHWTPLLLCSSAGFYGSVSVFFSSNVLVLLNGGHLIPFQVFQSISTWT